MIAQPCQACDGTLPACNHPSEHVPYKNACRQQRMVNKVTFLHSPPIAASLPRNKHCDIGGSR